MTAGSFHPDHIADLRLSGLNDETIKMMELYSVRPADISKLIGWDPEKIESALAFPYFGEHGFTNGFKRLKVFPPYKNKDGRLVKYLQRSESSLHLYILPSILKKLNNSTVQLTIVEGEKKTAKAVQEGILAIGISGLWNWVERGTARSITEFDWINWRGRSVPIIVDSDVWKDPDKKKEIARQQPVYALGKELEERGAKVTFLLLPDCDQGKVGLDDYLVLHSKDDLEQLSSITLNDHPLSGHKEWWKRWKDRRDFVDPSSCPEPAPLMVHVSAVPYPLDALPDTVRAAVIEVQSFTKAPIALVASSALGAISLAIQAYADMKRAEKLSGPVGLFFLTIADSGERKSTSDDFFTAAIREYEARQAEAAKDAIKEFKAASEAWEAKRGGIKDKIRQSAKARKPTAEDERALQDHEHDKPEPPRVPRLIYSDATPEALKWNLATGWPAAGVVAAEGGIVFGSHGMGKDSIMRNLATLNELWDGRPISTDRRTSESFTVRGARLTLALQVQEVTLRNFFDRSDGLARGAGFMARFLIAWPTSTQGFRPFTEAPSHWPALSAFNRRITAILETSVPIDDHGALSPTVLLLTQDAKAAWVTFHDTVERELASGGELHDVRDVASKAADNAARLAALFQVFEHGMGKAVSLEAIEGASRIVAWHLSESHRFFGELALPAEMANAVRLDKWLTEQCRRNGSAAVSLRTIQQYGPAGLREKAALDAAVRYLEELNRVRLIAVDKRKDLYVNPKLLLEEKS